jgi:hypothetical protein
VGVRFAEQFHFNQYLSIAHKRFPCHFLRSSSSACAAHSHRICDQSRHMLTTFYTIISPKFNGQSSRRPVLSCSVVAANSKALLANEINHELLTSNLPLGALKSTLTTKTMNTNRRSSGRGAFIALVSSTDRAAFN